MFGIALAMGVTFMIVTMIGAPFIRLAGTGENLAAGTAVMIGIAIAVPVYILAIWAMQLATYCWLWIPIIRHLATTLEIQNFAAAHEIAQSTQPRQKLGIADSFELGAF
jgi:hypothetical protein